MHKCIGTVQQIEYVQQVKYLPEFHQYHDTIVDGQNEKKQAERISKPTEAPVPDIPFLAPGKHVKIYKRHQQCKYDKRKDYAWKIHGLSSRDLESFSFCFTTEYITLLYRKPVI
jgi:hypothetical protein